jgi:hypothetical protein
MAKNRFGFQGLIPATYVEHIVCNLTLSLFNQKTYKNFLLGTSDPSKSTISTIKTQHSNIKTLQLDKSKSIGY